MYEVIRLSPRAQSYICGFEIVCKALFCVLVILKPCIYKKTCLEIKKTGKNALYIMK